MRTSETTETQIIGILGEADAVMKIWDNWRHNAI